MREIKMQTNGIDSNCVFMINARKLWEFAFIIMFISTQNISNKRKHFDDSAVFFYNIYDSILHELASIDLEFVHNQYQSNFENSQLHLTVSIPSMHPMLVSITRNANA